MKKHFVIATVGTAGDVFPFIEIARHLLGKNHKVSFITNPYFHNPVTSTGLSLIPFGNTEQLIALMNDPNMWNPRTGFRVVWAKVIQPNILCIRSYIQSLEPKEEVVILSHPALLALANLARADRKNVKVVLFHLCPTVIRSYFNKLALGGPITLPDNFPRVLRRLLYLLIDTLCLDIGVVTSINKERRRLRLTPITHYFPHLQNAADLYVTLFPEWYSSTKPDYPKPLINGNFVTCASSTDLVSDDLSQFLDAGPPPILVTAGSGNMHARKLFEVGVDVAKKLGVRAIFLTKFREQLPRDLPDSMAWQEQLPFTRVLPRVATIVHHGGIGTVAEACKAGTPQIIVPSAYDQFDNGVIVRDLGVGQPIAMQSLTRSRLLEKLSEVMGSKSVIERCADIAANYRSGAGVGQIVDRMLAAI